MFDLGTDAEAARAETLRWAITVFSLGHSQDTAFTKRCLWNLVIVGISKGIHREIGHRRTECMISR